MSLLLLDPLVLLLYLGVAAHSWLVWSGRFRRWFAADRLWLGLWPLPAVLALVPLLVGPLVRAASALAPVDEGGLVNVAVFLVASAAPIVALSVAPPRVLLPPWARERLTTPPPAPVDLGHPEIPEEAVAALHASHVTARVGVPRWRWRVDAVPGYAWIADERLHFRAVDDHEAASGRHELDQDEVDQLELQLGDDLRLRPPRGGWWTRRRLDVELGELDRWEASATRPWDRAGLLTLEVAGRRPTRLWTPRLDHLRRALESRDEPPEAT